MSKYLDDKTIAQFPPYKLQKWNESSKFADSQYLPFQIGRLITFKLLFFADRVNCLFVCLLMWWSGDYSITESLPQLI